MKLNSTIMAAVAGLTALSGQVTAEQEPNILVIIADDWGYGDLGALGNRSDVKTPNLDCLAKEGVLFTDGYVTAPQCAPSRAGLITGRYQQRYGFDSIPDCPLPLEEKTLADRLKNAGYVTGMVGKWHLDPNEVSLKWAQTEHPYLIRAGRVMPSAVFNAPYLPYARGFDFFFFGELSPYWCNYDLSGNDLAPAGQKLEIPGFRVDTQTEAALTFIQRNGNSPFFLYLAYFAPHVPLEATKKYLDRFPGDMPERRRTALAMMSAVDDGVGRIMALLEEKGLKENTLIFFTSDNGAPIGAHQAKPMDDILPVGKAGPAWDGSRNDPLRGEKGMLTEGGMRVPFIASWPKRLPQGMVCNDPVISLDIAATANAVAGLPNDPLLDGVNLVPYLTGSSPEKPHAGLFWRFWQQAAVRSGDWKLLQAGPDIFMLFNLQQDKEENHNVIGQYPEVARDLKKKLAEWTAQLEPAGLPDRNLNGQEKSWYSYYFNQPLK